MASRIEPASSRDDGLEERVARHGTFAQHDELLAGAVADRARDAARRLPSVEDEGDAAVELREDLLRGPTFGAAAPVRARHRKSAAARRQELSRHLMVGDAEGDRAAARCGEDDRERAGPEA